MEEEKHTKDRQEEDPQVGIEGNKGFIDEANGSFMQRLPATTDPSVPSNKHPTWHGSGLQAGSDDGVARGRMGPPRLPSHLIRSSRPLSVPEAAAHLSASS